MASDVTLCTVAFNGLEAASLMWESYLKYHDRPKLFVYENGSTDGTKEYFEERADFMWKAEKNDYHGWGLDRLCKKVETPYTLVVDTDVEFHKPTIPYLKQQNAFAVNQCKWYTLDDTPEFRRNFECYMGSPGGGGYTRQWGLMVYATLFRTEELQRLLEHVSFTMYINPERQELYDCGALLYRAAKCAGLKIVELDLAADGYLTHYWHVTDQIYVRRDPGQVEQVEGTYEVIRRRLAELRKPVSTRDKHEKTRMIL